MSAKATAKITAAREWPLDRIIPYEHNPRTHPSAQIDLLARLLERWGPDQDIVVDEAGVILKGHGRRLAAERAGMKTYPVRQRLGLSENEKTALRIADNQVALLSGWDTELIGFEIKRLERSKFDVSLLGFGEKQLVQFTTQPGPPVGGFQAFGENVPVEHECPKCKYRWSGSSSPAAAETEKTEKPTSRGRRPGK